MNDEILIVQFKGFNASLNHYSDCIILIKEKNYSLGSVYQISIKNGHIICSEIQVNHFNEEKLREVENQFQHYYLTAKKIGFAFLFCKDNSKNTLMLYRVPRITENDFEFLIDSMGGNKIAETNEKTPDFQLFDSAIELKDIQQESLYNKERQRNISKIFEGFPRDIINLDPAYDFGDYSQAYWELIMNSIKSTIKAASKQLKSFKLANNISKSGVVILNTGMYSLPHELLLATVADTITRQLKSIDFALVFSQKMQTNGWNLICVSKSDWIGNVPEKISPLKASLNTYFESKMSQMMYQNDSEVSLKNQIPISFESNNKIFFWDPGQIPFPWDKEGNKKK